MGVLEAEPECFLSGFWNSALDFGRVAGSVARGRSPKFLAILPIFANLFFFFTLWGKNNVLNFWPRSSNPHLVGNIT